MPEPVSTHKESLYQKMPLNLTKIYHNPDLTENLRQLAWCIGSPSLLNERSELINAHNITAAALSDDESEGFIQCLTDNKIQPHLDKWLNNVSSNRLGHIFESHWHFYWSHLSTKTKPADTRFNLQINENGSTKGELDALFYSPYLQSVDHYELAIKFYLGNPTKNNQTQWIGPNSRDRLDLKINQMVTKQLKLLDSAINHLPKDWIVKRINRKILMKGWLFQPIESFLNNNLLMPPEYVSPEHSKGIWLKKNQLNKLEQYCNEYESSSEDDMKWVVLDRKQWLGHYLSTDLNSQQNSVSIESIKLKFEENQERPLMFLRTKKRGLNSNNKFQWADEVQRFILVNDHWPETT